MFCIITPIIHDELLINKHKSSKNDIVIMKINMKPQTLNLLRADSSLQEASFFSLRSSIMHMKHDLCAVLISSSDVSERNYNNYYRKWDLNQMNAN